MGNKSELYWLSFVEEGIMNPEYRECTGGRIEIWTYTSQWAIKEIRWLTYKKDQFYQFRETWDGVYLNLKWLKRIEVVVRQRFQDCQGPKP